MGGCIQVQSNTRCVVVIISGEDEIKYFSKIKELKDVRIAIFFYWTMAILNSNFNIYVNIVLSKERHKAKNVVQNHVTGWDKPKPQFREKKKS